MTGPERCARCGQYSEWHPNRGEVIIDNGGTIRWYCPAFVLPPKKPEEQDRIEERKRKEGGA